MNRFHIPPEQNHTPQYSSLSKKRLTVYLFALLPAALTFMVYLPALHSGFVNWDDGTYIYNNKEVTEIDILLLDQYIESFFTSIVGRNWHPVTMLSHLLDANIWGLNPWGHHLSSIIIHALNTFLVYLLIFHLCLLKSADKLNGIITGIVTALLFGIHPIHVESVTWISERKDVLCAFFFLMSLYFYIRYCTFSGNSKTKYYFITLIFFALALMSKPMTVSLPLVLLILDFYPLDRFSSDNKVIKKILLEKIPFFALSFLLAIITIWSQKANLSSEYTLGMRVFIPIRNIIYYLYKLVVPTNLLPLYPLPGEIHFFSVEYVGSIILVLLISYIVFIVLKKNRVFLAVWLYYIVTLLPVIGILHVGRQIAADRYSYLPSLAPSLLFGLLCTYIFKKIPKKQLKIVVPVVMAFFFSVMAKATVLQIAIWHDSFTLWTYQIDHNPGVPYHGYINRADAYTDDFINVKDYKLALTDLNKAIENNPDKSEAYYERGELYIELGMYEAALKDFTKCLTQSKSVDRDVFYYYQRGIAYYGLKNFLQAIQDLRKVIILRPDASKAHYYLGRIYSDIGNYPEAINAFKKALNIFPGYADANYYLGRVYKKKGDKKNAAKYLFVAGMIDPEIFSTNKKSEKTQDNLSL